MFNCNFWFGLIVIIKLAECYPRPEDQLMDNVTATGVMPSAETSTIHTSVQEISPGMNLENVFANLFQNFAINQTIEPIKQQINLATDLPQVMAHEMIMEQSTMNGQVKPDEMSTGGKMVDDMTSPKMVDDMASPKMVDDMTSTKMVDDMSSLKMLDDMATTKMDDHMASTKMEDHMASHTMEDHMSISSKMSEDVKSPRKMLDTMDDHEMMQQDQPFENHSNDMSINNPTMLEINPTEITTTPHDQSTSIMTTTTSTESIAVDKFDSSVENIKQIDGFRNIEPATNSHEFEKYVTQSNDNQTDSVQISSANHMKFSLNLCLIIYLINYYL